MPSRAGHETASLPGSRGTRPLTQRTLPTARRLMSSTAQHPRHWLLGTRRAMSMIQDSDMGFGDAEDGKETSVKYDTISETLASWNKEGHVSYAKNSGPAIVAVFDDEPPGMVSDLAFEPSSVFFPSFEDRLSTPMFNKFQKGIKAMVKFVRNYAFTEKMDDEDSKAVEDFFYWTMKDNIQDNLDSTIFNMTPNPVQSLLGNPDLLLSKLLDLPRDYIPSSTNVIVLEGVFTAILGTLAPASLETLHTFRTQQTVQVIQEMRQAAEHAMDHRLPDFTSVKPLNNAWQFAQSQSIQSQE
ncbi:hypothetical protein QBC38DRAFT_459266 [Podospora fimiseda]|uniref:Uncharacterized protein n=1 Tax=Podospora fimiseda TaxID=252190 RepID=A0AAN7BHS9_9PEZI|nr:hypothetical protein QBC38DRAFT_459266 [Podospora fimiseda]